MFALQPLSDFQSWFICPDYLSISCPVLFSCPDFQSRFPVLISSPDYLSISCPVLFSCPDFLSSLPVFFLYLFPVLVSCLFPVPISSPDFQSWWSVLITCLFLYLFPVLISCPDFLSFLPVWLFLPYTSRKSSFQRFVSPGSNFPHQLGEKKELLGIVSIIWNCTVYAATKHVSIIWNCTVYAATKHVSIFEYVLRLFF